MSLSGAFALLLPICEVTSLCMIAEQRATGIAPTPVMSSSFLEGASTPTGVKKRRLQGACDTCKHKKSTLHIFKF